MSEFDRLIQMAAENIDNGKYEEAEQYIKSAMNLEISAPQPHNLFGILLEYRGDRLRALKHYRAATDLDPTYLPAKNNLYRTGLFFETSKADFGKR